MEDNQKKYVSYLGYDYTQYIKTEEDVKKFEKLCELEKKTKGVKFSKCFKEVIEVLNLDRELRGHKQNVSIQGKLGTN